MAKANPSLHTILLLQVRDASTNVLDVRWVRDVSVGIAGSGRGAGMRRVRRETVVEGRDACDVRG
jgi:hypothetical protein